MSRGLGKVQKGIVAELIGYPYQSTEDLTKGVYHLYPDGSRREAIQWSDAQIRAVQRALRRLKTLGQVTLSVRTNARGEPCWMLTKQKPLTNASVEAKARAQGPRLALVK